MIGPGGLAAIVLAGGRSRRMGRDKASIDVGGEPLVARVARAVGEVCAPVVVVAAPDQVLPSLPAGVRVARDPAAFEGPLVGLAAGLGALDAGEPRRAVVVAVDAVRTSAVLVAALAGLGSEEAVIALADEEGRALPLPVVLPVARARAEAAVLLAAGRRSLRALVEALAPVVVSRQALLAASPALAAADPGLRGLEDADDEEALRRLVGSGTSG